MSITASIEASITATSVYTANLHRSLPVFTATITAASIYTAAMEAGAQVYTTDFAISSALSLPLICLYCLIGRLPFVMRSSNFEGM